MYEGVARNTARQTPPDVNGTPSLGSGGPAAAVCADYRRKMSWASPEIVHARQIQDNAELIERRSEWAGQAEVMAYRCEVNAGGEISFRVL